MPTSDQQGKEHALAWYAHLRPATVVDIGPGCGTYAALMRPHHRAHWTGVDVWAPYVDAYRLDRLYDELVVADARHLDPTRFGVDLVIAGDVLEHMPAADACALIARIQQHARALLVSVPVLHLDQGAVGGNPFETHVDHWTAPGMRGVLGAGVVAEWIGDVLAYFLWRRE
ncbi:class I SAM-dependent methyltransferase [Actinomadura fulvescens]|uniref:Methyltransferase domain-containing protein n=1 Tax=Actinomadura fulvescens TaxID=46160 RepID=A0ABN3Q743_9ACTN